MGHAPVNFGACRLARFGKHPKWIITDRNIQINDPPRDAIRWAGRITSLQRTKRGRERRKTDLLARKERRVGTLDIAPFSMGALTYSDNQTIACVEVKNVQQTWTGTPQLPETRDLETTPPSPKTRTRPTHHMNNEPLKPKH